MPTVDARDIPDTDDEVQIRFPIEAGLLVRGSLRQVLARENFRYDQLTITWHEKKDWLESNFEVKVKGPANLVRRWCVSFRNWILEVS